MATHEHHTGEMRSREEEQRTRTGTGGEYGTAGTTGVGGVSAGGFGNVVLTIKSGHNMIDKAWVGKADPYVEVTLADATISTHHISNAGETATWDESFRFNNAAPDDVMHFSVYDKNRLRKDALMGEGSLTLRNCFESGRMETRVPLTSRTGTKDAGELWITLRMDEGGMRAGQKTGYETGAATTTTTGYETGAATTTATHTTGTHATTGTRTTETEGPVCGQEFFTKVEDRPQVVETRTYIKEHRPVEKEFEVVTRPTGVEREAAEGRTVEHLGTEERIVAESKPRAPCD